MATAVEKNTTWAELHWTARLRFGALATSVSMRRTSSQQTLLLRPARFYHRTGGRGFLRQARRRSSLLRPVRQEEIQRAPIRRSQRQAFRPENDINQITWQVQSVTEMAEASKYFRDLGVEIMREGRAGRGGSQFHLYVWAPDEQIFELYYGIEQISWNGYARPAPMRHGTPTPPMEPQLPTTNWCVRTSKRASTCSMAIDG